MKKKVFIVAAALLLLIAAGAIYNYFALDNLGGLIFPLFMDEDTEYAPGYNDQAFRKVAAGMTQPEVSTLLGQPLSTLYSRDGETAMAWTRSPSGEHYRWRVVYFVDGKVDRTLATFY